MIRVSNAGENSEARDNHRKGATGSALRTSTLFLGIVLFLSGCLAPVVSSPDFRNGARLIVEDLSKWRLQNIEVNFPEEMEIATNPNIRYPASDKLVWYGDGAGDRKEQVRSLVADAITKASDQVLTGDLPVEVVILVRQFHAMTPKARISNWQLGVHEISFDIEIRDAEGKVIGRELGVNADIEAYSGVKAVMAEARGETQRKRIQERITQVIKSWLIPGTQA